MPGPDRKPQFTTEQMIEAIKGTGGIKAAIARRLGCHRGTIDRYILRNEQIRQAYHDECEAVGDYAETLLVQNIKLALQRQQEQNEIVDTADAKWYLERKRRGYSHRIEAMLQNLDLTKLKDDQLQRLAAGEDPFEVMAETGGVPVRGEYPPITPEQRHNLEAELP